MNKSYTVMELEAIKKLCKCVNSVASLPADLIADTNVATNTTYSSYKIDAEMSALETDIQSYVDTALAGLNKLTKEVIDDKALVVKENVLYLYKDPSDMNNDYMQMMLVNGVVIELGTTQADFSSVYSKDEIDDKFALKIDLDVLTTSFNNLVTTVENKIDKDKIATTLDNTATDEQVVSALLTKTELDKTNAKLGELSDSLVDIESALDELENVTRLTDFDEAIPEKGKNKIYYVNKSLGTYICAQWRVESMYYDVSGMEQYRGVQIATSINGVDNIMLMRAYYLEDNNVMRWSAWQELATTVAGVGVTTITPVNSAITGTIEYTVKNGICYVSLINVKSTTNDNGISISTTMPKPAINSRSSIVKQVGNGNIGIVYINKNTTQLTANIYISDIIGDCTFSYPVAE